VDAANRAASALLGALLIDPEAVKVVRPIVAPEDFPTPNGREVYTAILALDDRGVPADFVAVCCELERRGTAERIGTAQLVALINRCPTSLHAEHYARLVAEAADRRRLPEASGLPAGAMTW
jgi:replicative DNA helicase